MTFRFRIDACSLKLKRQYDCAESGSTDSPSHAQRAPAAGRTGGFGAFLNQVRDVASKVKLFDTQKNRKKYVTCFSQALMACAISWKSLHFHEVQAFNDAVKHPPVGYNKSVKCWSAQSPHAHRVVVSEESFCMCTSAHRVKINAWFVTPECDTLKFKESKHWSI